MQRHDRKTSASFTRLALCCDLMRRPWTRVRYPAVRNVYVSYYGERAYVQVLLVRAQALWTIGGLDDLSLIKRGIQHSASKAIWNLRLSQNRHLYRIVGERTILKNLP